MPVVYYTESEWSQLSNENAQLRNNAERHARNVRDTKLLLDEKDAVNRTLADALTTLWFRLDVKTQEEALAKVEQLKK